MYYAMSLIILGFLGNIMLTGSEGLEKEEKISIYLILIILTILITRKVNIN